MAQGTGRLHLLQQVSRQGTWWWSPKKSLAMEELFRQQKEGLSFFLFGTDVQQQGPSGPSGTHSGVEVQASCTEQTPAFKWQTLGKRSISISAIPLQTCPHEHSGDLCTCTRHCQPHRRTNQQEPAPSLCWAHTPLIPHASRSERADFAS